VVDDDSVVGGDVSHAPHPVHGLDGVEPALPAPAGQVLPDPSCLQVLEGVKIRGCQPGMLQTLRGCESLLCADHLCTMS